MKRNISIQFKAAFLLTVFALNTIVGFACSMGVGMGFNMPRHHDDDKKEISVHVHADGKKHQHHRKKDNDVSVNHDAEEKKHHHHEAEKQEPEKNGNSKTDDCCNDKVVKIIQADKAVSHSNPLVHPVFFTAFISAYCNIDEIYLSQVATSNKYLVLGHHPPIADVRIAIQSFQI